MEETQAQLCSCGAEFSPWAMKDKGGNQSHPFKYCYNCRMRKKVERAETPYAGEGGGQSNTSNASDERLTKMGVYLQEEFNRINDKLDAIIDKEK